MTDTPIGGYGYETREDMPTQVVDNPPFTTPAVQQPRITGTNIGQGTITAEMIQANAITAGQIQSGAITSNEIAAGTITTANIQAGAITASLLNVAALSAIVADLGTVTAGTISGTNVNIDLAATGSSTAFEVGDKFRARANGDVDLSGALTFYTGIWSGLNVPVGGVAYQDAGASAGVTMTDSTGGALVRFKPAGSVEVFHSTATLDLKDSGTAAATESGWIEVDIGGTTAYLRAYASK